MASTVPLKRYTHLIRSIEKLFIILSPRTPYFTADKTHENVMGQIHTHIGPSFEIFLSGKSVIWAHSTTFGIKWIPYDECIILCSGNTNVLQKWEQQQCLKHRIYLIDEFRKCVADPHYACARTAFSNRA